MLPSKMLTRHHSLQFKRFVLAALTCSYDSLPGHRTNSDEAVKNWVTLSRGSFQITRAQVRLGAAPFKARYRKNHGSQSVNQQMRNCLWNSKSHAKVLQNSTKPGYLTECVHMSLLLVNLALNQAHFYATPCSFNDNIVGRPIYHCITITISSSPSFSSQNDQPPPPHLSSKTLNRIVSLLQHKIYIF